MDKEKTEKTTVPAGTVFTLKIPADRDRSKFFTFYIRDMDEDIYVAVKKFIDEGKEFDAVRMAIKNLQVGGDSVDLLKDNFVAANSARRQLMELISPVEGELKKN